jgi:hypothetical protein
MLLLFLIVGIAGAAVFFMEQKNRKENEQQFAEFVRGVKANDDLTQEEKREHIKNLYLLNGFKLVQTNHKSVTVSKKYFSLGAAMMWFGVVGIGVIVYLVYLLFKRPEVKIIFFE